MKHVLVPLAEGCEELEAVTVIDLLRRAEIKVTVASLGDRLVHCSRGLTLQAECNLDKVMESHFDMIVLPGGLPGADHLNNDSRIGQLLHRISASGGYSAAICAAPKVLASHGLLHHRSATAYPGTLEACKVEGITLSQAAIEIDEKIITSRGPGTAMDFALILIEKLLGKEKCNSVEHGLQR